MNRYTEELEKLQSHKDFINLINTNFTSLEPQISFDDLAPFIQEYYKGRKYEPEPKGLLTARKAIQSYYADRHITINPENLIITASTSESYNQLFTALKDNPGKILLPKPSYPLFEFICKFTQTKYDFYQLKMVETKWEIDIESIKKEINGTKALVLISPNNPTGSVIDQTTLDEIYKICEENKVTLIIDEVFSDYIFDKVSTIKYYPEKATTILLNGISKTSAMPDLKLAWINILGKGNDELVDELETINDTYLNANQLSQYLLPTILKKSKELSPAWLQNLIENRNILKTFIKDNPKIKCALPQGGIHACISFSTLTWENEEIAIKLLKEFKLGVHPGYFYDFEANSPTIVISLLQNTEIFEKGISRIGKFVIEYS